MSNSLIYKGQFSLISNTADSLHLLASHWPSGLVTHLMPAAPLQVHTSVLPR